MSDVRNDSSSGSEHTGGISPGSNLQPAPQSEQVVRTVESSVITSVPIGAVGAKERNLMFLITGCSGLFLSNTLALLAVVWNFYNTTHGLPAVVLPEWAVGFIFSTYGSAVVVWVQNKIEKALARKND